MRAFFGVLAALLLVGVLAGIGTAIYNEGVAAGFAAGQQAEGEGAQVVVTTAAPGLGAGFGVTDLVGIAFATLIFIIALGLLSMVFRINRHGPGPRGWERRHGGVEEFHRELHRREHEGSATPAGT